MINFDLLRDRLNFAAPAFLRKGEVSAGDLEHVCNAMAIYADDVLASRWIDNGAGWAGLLESASDLLAVKTRNNGGRRTNLADYWGTSKGIEAGGTSIEKGSQSQQTMNRAMQKVNLFLNCMRLALGNSRIHKPT
ncbi:hypothetical protein OPQ81_011352 [Rhizoctonia solani]|nr:hypothetical protein OPQ81_011352 [Rhizoctonia solani]